jgi:acyl-homoserine-lactone acylase
VWGDVHPNPGLRGSVTPDFTSWQFQCRSIIGRLPAALPPTLEAPMTSRLFLAGSVALALSFATAGCSDDATSDTDTTNVTDTTDTTDDTTDTEVTLPDIVDIDPYVERCGTPPTLAERTYTADIRWGSYGIPSITGSDVPNAVFAQLYAQSRDHICTLADRFVATRSERALYFGAGSNNANINNDFGWLAEGLREKANCHLASMSTTSREMIRAVAAGYNHYLAETGLANLPEACRDQAWVKPISELDVAAYFLSLTVRASGDVFLNFAANSVPPETTAAGPMSIMPDPAMAAALMPHHDVTAPEMAMGSNGWGIGSERSETGNGMVLVNPHFPWEGSLRLYETQLTVPGELNVHGVGLIGTPGILIGFNEDVAWTHTVSASERFSLYFLALDSSDPTVYQYGDERRRMATETETITVKADDGTLAEETRTFYYSHYGPIVAIQPLGWNTNFVLTFRDANIENDRIFDHFLAMNQAGSLEDYKASYQKSGIPWVNAMYADKDGNAFYIDGTMVPYMSDEAIAWFDEAVAGDGSGQAAAICTLVFGSFGAHCFDGSNPEHEWVVDESAPHAGVEPYDRMPKLTRTDFISNANNSHWLTNPAAPLEGYSPLYGPEKTQRSSRTRMNLVELTETGDDAASGADGKFSFEELKAVRTNGRAYLAETMLADVVARCAGEDSAVLGDATVPIADACAVLTAWDGRQTLDTAGGPLWREFVYGLIAADGYAFVNAFDPADPVDTPNTLIPAPTDGVDPVLTGLASAVTNLEAAGFSADVTHGEAQYTLKGDTRLSVPGGQGGLGAFNAVAYSRDSTTLLPKIERPPVINARSGLTEDGYLITYGTSFVAAIEFTDDGPRADALLTYSQSADPASDHFSDQTEIFAVDGWRSIRFTEEDIAADPNLVTETVTTAL